MQKPAKASSKLTNFFILIVTVIVTLLAGFTVFEEDSHLVPARLENYDSIVKTPQIDSFSFEPLNKSGW